RLVVMPATPVGYPLISPPRPGGGPTTQAAQVARPIIGGGQSSTVMLVDVSKPADMKVLKTMSVNGGYLSARLTGHTARVIFSATPQVLPVLQTVAVPDQRPKIE